MAAKNGQLVVRCFAYPGKNAEIHGVYAVCIDLNLVTWRPTLQEAKKSLNDAIAGYFETLVEVKEENESLLNIALRPAPFWPYRVQYHLLAFRRALRTPKINSDSLLFDDSVNFPFSATA